LSRHALSSARRCLSGGPGLGESRGGALPACGAGRGWSLSAQAVVAAQWPGWWLSPRTASRAMLTAAANNAKSAPILGWPHAGAASAVASPHQVRDLPFDLGSSGAVAVAAAPETRSQPWSTTRPPVPAVMAPSHDLVVTPSLARHRCARAGSAGRTSTGYGAACTAASTSSHAEGVVMPREPARPSRLSISGHRARRESPGPPVH
jgi:hypothetical protein